MDIDYDSQQSKWSIGLFECGGNPSTFFITWGMPCVTFGQIAEVVDEGKHSCFAHGLFYNILMTVSCQWLYACTFRRKLRAMFGLPSAPCNDCCVHLCCHSCALCQEHAELKYRGFDPCNGWIGLPKAHPLMPPSMERF
ncbi:hypothetical protein QVD17_35417 [Tagetes erecta]|uniref:Uncharacterized protein n=1 Tax=Tagetes erecta TaxID=13708 RepID=A0AAD8NMD3_TARER|nr:hypothetical protein QVD17_35417 [Tagetes erecta]